MTKEEWFDFIEEFDKVYNKFTIRLKEFCPSISPSETYLCCLLKLKRSASDISLFLNINKQSVHRIKTRLKRNKFMMENSIDFDEFLENF